MAYLISGLLALGLMLGPYIWRFRHSTTNAKIKYLNSCAVGLSLVYLALTIFSIVKQPLPLLAAKDYLYIDSLALYEVLITCIVFFLASLYGHGYTKLLVEEKGLRANSLNYFIVHLSCFLS
jgi:formate hydrogenlyase subunit 3/multisubunit Na+/H+ antiporter MnhD subunit